MSQIGVHPIKWDSPIVSPVETFDVGNMSSVTLTVVVYDMDRWPTVKKHMKEIFGL